MHLQILLFANIIAPLLVSAQLNSLAKAAGKLYFGTATENTELTGNATNVEYVSILSNTTEFGQLTPARLMKWIFTEPEEGVFNFTGGDQIADLASANGQILRCHTLVWHQTNRLPPYILNGTWDADNLTAALTEHVTKEVSHYAGKCYAWDVVNEALNEDGTFRNDTFYSILGTSYLNIAFSAAAAADPNAKLYYNDYNVESPSPKSTAAQGIISMLKDAGVKIDGMGLQSHFTAGQTPSIDSQIDNMKAFAKLGVEVAVTELDVRLELPANESNLAQQSRDYEATVGACMQVEECRGITVWDFYDPFSWIPGNFPGFGDADLYFENFTTHPAYAGVVSALTNSTKSTV